MTTIRPNFRTLEELQQRKEELRTAIQTEGKQANQLWHSLTDSQPANSKGELIANLIANSITAIDAFLLVRKLMKTYGKFFHKNRKR